MTKRKTRQELFDNAWNGFAKQGWVKSIKTGRHGPACMYRGPNGSRCAVGWSIPDDTYDSSIEDKRADNPKITVRAGISQNDASFAVELQNVHDYAYDHRDGVKNPQYIIDANPKHDGLEIRMKEFAKIYDLKIPGSEDE